MTPREKTIRIKGSGRGVPGETMAWGRGGQLVFYSPPKGTLWGGGFGVQITLDIPSLGLFISPTEARRIAAELVKRAEDLEGRL